MLSIPAPPRRGAAVEHQQQFAAMLPTITRAARHAFRDLDPEGREEAVAEVIAAAYLMFVGLVQRSRGEVAYPTVLAMYGIRRVKIDRKAATKLNVLDVGSEYCQPKKSLTVERLDGYDRDTESWHEILLEDRRPGTRQPA